MHHRGGWVVLRPRGPRSRPGYAVPVRPHLIDPIRPTRRHIATSPLGGLYAMPSLCGSALSDPRVVPCFRFRSFSTCRPLRPRGARRLHMPSSFADSTGLRRVWNSSALPSNHHPLPMVSVFAVSLVRSSLRPVELLASLDGSDRVLPSQPRLLPPGFRWVGHPSHLLGITTVTTGQVSPVGLSPTGTSASIAAPTPPDMRVRIRRFGRLRLISKSGHPRSVVVAGGESGVNQLGGTRPPAFVDGRGLRRCRVRQSESAHLGEDFGAALPLFEL
jgi:hypothetical protein